MMYGHVDQPRHWLGHLRALAAHPGRTGGFTEFVPLPFVHPTRRSTSPASPGRARPRGTTARCTRWPGCCCTGGSTNIQCSWVKLGDRRPPAMLRGGANDLGGTLMEETISRMAGSEHGSRPDRRRAEAIATAAGRPVRQRTTTYEGEPDAAGPEAVAAARWPDLAAPHPRPAPRRPTSRGVLAQVGPSARKHDGVRSRPPTGAGGAGGGAVHPGPDGAADPSTTEPSGQPSVGRRSWSARTQVAWKPSGTRCGSWTRATGPAAMSDASRISTSDRPSRSSVTKLTR